MKPVFTLIVIANEADLRLLENAGVGKGLRQISAKSRDDFADVATRYADAPGREQAAPGTAIHGLDRSSSERRQMREAFAAHVVQEAEAEWKTGTYSRIVLAASPKMLGALRAALPKTMSDHLLADLDKDLAKLPLADLPAHLEDVLAV